MKMREIYNYKNPKYAKLKEPMRNLIGAWGDAEKWFATLKEWPLIEAGMPSLSDAIHKLEHVQPERIDAFAHAYRPWHLELIYPATDELVEEIGDLDHFFEICVGIVDHVDEALMNMIKVTSGGEFNSLALSCENLQIENQQDKEKLLQAWEMWDNGVSPSSYDKWIAHLYGLGMEEDDD